MTLGFGCGQNRDPDTGGPELRPCWFFNVLSLYRGGFPQSKSVSIESQVSARQPPSLST